MRGPKKGSKKRRHLISSTWTLKISLLGEMAPCRMAGTELLEQPTVTITFRRSDALTAVLMKTKSSEIGHLLLQGSVK
jgi:hypothetical protein